MLGPLRSLGQHEICFMSWPLFLSVLAIIFMFLYQKFLGCSTDKRKLTLPPSPPKFPIVGNLLHIGPHTHRSLRDLAQKVGSLMLLYFGSVPVLVVSSADAAHQIMKANDLTFASRPTSSTSARKLLYDYKDVSMAPYGQYWRQLKSICMIHLLSNRRVQSYRAVREEETFLAIANMKKFISSGLPVNLTELFSTVTNNVICRVALGRKYNEEEEDGNKFHKLLSEFVELLGAINIGDYIPWLAWISHVNGFNAKVDKVAKEFDAFLDGVIDDHTGIRSEDQKDFVDVLLDIQKEERVDFPLERVTVKALILDMFAAGADTTYTVMEWTMTELLSYPKIMKELQKEVRKVCGDKSDILEDDLDNMHYLKAVIKETLRLHPPLPLLVPRVSSKDAKVKGFDIEQGTEVIINAWAIGRDPLSWEKPEEYLPERFLNNSIDFKGHHFELIPFGAGRRICPGILFAMKLNEFVLANLMHKFDWSLPEGVKEMDLDMTESVGLTIHKRSPLVAIAKPCSF